MYSRILVPIDGSAAARKGLGEAIRLAKALGAELKLVHVVNEFMMDASYVPSVYYDPLVTKLREVGGELLAAVESTVHEQGVAVQSELLEASGRRAADSILEVARQWPAELIVMGTHGRRGLYRLALGSDAETVLRAADVPVLLVRAEGEV
jgi:nucleotide-binding universal stress UspA family protein